MSGLLALLDDVAGIAKLAAASVDDAVAQAAKAGSKTAGIIIDDAAVTPKYVAGLAAARELPIIWKITRASLFNKLVILLPLLLALSYFAPWVITPLLMLGGSYLCFEGAEKVFHVLFPHGSEAVHQDMSPKDPAHLEEERVKGAIKTDFILSAEIMTISLAAIEAERLGLRAMSLAIVGVAITILVYGSVAAIVKADDVGLKLAQVGRLSATRAFGRGLVRWMPTFMKVLSFVGTIAMLWVGGSIIIHGLKDLGWPVLYDWIHDLAVGAAVAVPSAEGAVEWAVTAGLDGIFGLAYGLLLIPLVTKVLGPIFGRFTGKEAAGH